MIARVVYQNAAHQLSRDPEEVCTVLPAHILLINESQVGFVDQRRSLKRMAGSFPTHVVTRKALQLFMDERNETVKRRLISIPPIHEQLGDICWRGRRHIPAVALSNFLRSADYSAFLQSRSGTSENISASVFAKASSQAWAKRSKFGCNSCRC